MAKQQLEQAVEDKGAHELTPQLQAHMGAVAFQERVVLQLALGKIAEVPIPVHQGILVVPCRA